MLGVLLELGDEVVELGDALLEPCWSFGEPLLVPEAPDGVLAAPLVDGRFISTSPPEVLVVVLPCAALPVEGTQSVGAADEVVCVAALAPPMLDPVVEADAEPVVPAAPVVVLAASPETPPLALDAPLADPLVDGVGAVPFAPFVAFNPVKR